MTGSSNDLTPTGRLAFLVNLERLLSEGSFVATYKYALLIALAELSIERADDSGAEFELQVGDLAAKFIELYWRQALPYGNRIADAASGVLIQAAGQQAAVFREVIALQGRFGNLASAQASEAWTPALKRISRLLDEMPLWRLQKLRHGSLEFLYRPGSRPDTIVLLRGVAANFRHLHSFVLRMVQSEWLRFVQSLPANQRLLGATSDLSSFLFGADRGAIVRAAPKLRELQSGRCFYCESMLRAAVDVDHFIPWSRYPRDLVHNLVVAHRTCNSLKSDVLAAEPHRLRWTQWIAAHDRTLGEIGLRSGLLVDRLTALSVADWSYAHARQIGAEVWLGGSEYAPIGPGLVAER
jgi:hypothetical protein